MHTNHVRRGALPTVGFALGMTLVTTLSATTTATAAVGLPEPVLAATAPVAGPAPVGPSPVATPVVVAELSGSETTPGSPEAAPAHDSSPTAPPTSVAPGPVDPVEQTGPPEPTDPPVVHAGPGPATPGDGVTTLIDPVTIERSASAERDETG